MLQDYKIVGWDRVYSNNDEEEQEDQRDRAKKYPMHEN